MTDGQLWLDRDRAARGARDLALAGRAVGALRERVGGRIAAASARRPWGNDDIGGAFERQYRGFEAMLLRAWEGVGGAVEDLGVDVLTSVESNVRTDMASGRRFDRVAGQPVRDER